MIVKLINYDLKGKILEEKKYKYNINQQLIELVINTTGIDPYSLNETDEAPGNFRIDFGYNIYGFLTTKLHYKNERISRKHSYIRR
jgi:hypothetical protein